MRPISECRKREHAYSLSAHETTCRCLCRLPPSVNAPSRRERLLGIWNKETRTRRFPTSGARRRSAGNKATDIWLRTVPGIRFELSAMGISSFIIRSRDGFPCVRPRESSRSPTIFVSFPVFVQLSARSETPCRLFLHGMSRRQSRMFLFVEYWGESVEPGSRISRWLEKADALASGWKPSESLFLD